MKEIVVVSGKGGVGKTSISAALCRLFAPLAIADADVDAADLPLVLPHSIEEQQRQPGARLAEVDARECWGCTACVRACRFGAITCNPKAVIDATACEGCGACVAVCAAEAISLQARENGSLLRASSIHGPFTYARLDPGAENSGRLVSAVRQQARAAGRAAGLDLLLIDGPPGCGCPATAAITGCDLVLAVCEPSISARHDLLRLLDLVAHFAIPVLAVVNKADLADEQLLRLQEDLAARHIPIAAALPYDEAFTEAQLRGADVLDLASPALRQAFTDLVTAIRAVLSTPPPVHGIP
jgi:MinD superfamily P-loop ATPase